MGTDWSSYASFSPSEHDDSLPATYFTRSRSDWRHNGVPIDAVSGRELEVSAEELGLRRRAA